MLCHTKLKKFRLIKKNWKWNFGSCVHQYIESFKESNSYKFEYSLTYIIDFLNVYRAYFAPRLYYCALVWLKEWTPMQKITSLHEVWFYDVTSKGNISVVTCSCFIEGLVDFIKCYGYICPKVLSILTSRKNDTSLKSGQVKLIDVEQLPFQEEQFCLLWSRFAFIHWVRHAQNIR